MFFFDLHIWILIIFIPRNVHAVILEVKGPNFEMYFQKPLCQSDAQLQWTTIEMGFDDIGKVNMK